MGCTCEEKTEIGFSPLISAGDSFRMAESMPPKMVVSNDPKSAWKLEKNILRLIQAWSDSLLSDSLQVVNSA